MATKLNLAEAQFYGFYVGKTANLRELVNSMGLTKVEWKMIKINNYHYLSEDEIQEVDEMMNRN